MATTANSINTAAGGFRKTSAGVQLGRAVFDPSQQGSLQPSQIANLLRAAGVPVPKAAVVGTDVAQLIMSGGAFVEAAETAAEVGDFINPAVGVMKATTTLLSDCGLMDAKSPAAQIMTLVLEAALIVSSGGMNVLADIGFVLSVIGDLLAAPDTRATQLAKSQFQAAKFTNTYIQVVFDRSAKQAAVNFAAYQSGKLSIFQYIDAIAQESPELFANYFPGLGAFLPPATVQSVTATAKNLATHGGFVGFGTQYEIETASSTGQYKQTVVSPSQLAQDLINGLLLKPWAPYGWLNAACRSQALLRAYGYPAGSEKIGVKPSQFPPLQRFLLQDWACLSLIPPYIKQVNPNTDIRKLFTAFGITPYDLGYDIFPGEYAGFAAASPSFPNIVPPIVINGVDYYSPSQVVTLKNQDHMRAVYAEVEAELEKLITADHNSDWNTLLTHPIGSLMLAEFGVLPSLPGTVYTAAYGSNGAGRDYRNLQNYFSILATANQIRTDPFFTKGPGIPAYDAALDAAKTYILPPVNRLNSIFNPNELASSQDSLYDTGLHNFTPPSNWNPNLAQLSMIPTPEQFEAQHQNIQLRVVARHLNHLARANVASFFGTTPDKVKITKGKNGLAQVQSR